MQIAVNCGAGRQTCKEIGGGRTFTLQSGKLYQGSDGRYYSLTYTAGGFGLMQAVIDARSPAQPSNPGMGAGSLLDQYGGVSGGHDWYLIAIALLTLYLVMKFQPKWGVPLGYLVLAGAVLSTDAAVGGFRKLVESIQTGSIAPSRSVS